MPRVRGPAEERPALRPGARGHVRGAVLGRGCRTGSRPDRRGGLMTRRDIPGLTVVITGAARGIGEATAELLASEGATVALGDLDEALVLQVAERIGRGAVGARLDVTSPESWQLFL